jgi:hypothetical protein
MAISQFSELIRQALFSESCLGSAVRLAGAKRFVLTLVQIGGIQPAAPASRVEEQEEVGSFGD